MKLLSKTALCTALGALSLFVTSCDVDVVEKGKMPEVDVKAGKLPQIDVDAPEVTVGTKEVEVEVPKITTETETISVPVIGVEAPKDDAEENPSTKKEEGL